MRTARAIGLGVLAVAMAGCIDRPVASVPSRTQSSYTDEVQYNHLNKVDLLLVVDNSTSMDGNQANIARQLRRLVERLTSAPDANGDGMPDRQPIQDLQVAVISSDLGANGSPVSNCNRWEHGDDGLFNPIERGAGLSTRRPENVGVRARCANRPAPSSVLRYVARETNIEQFSDDFVCSAMLGTGGCGLEQQLESVHRSLVQHGAHNSSGPNAGFVRPDALLAIVLLTDEEDGSVRDCRYASPTDPSACNDARGVYCLDSSCGTWAGDELFSRIGAAVLDYRLYAYQPGSQQDPTWNLDRYHNPRDASAGWLSLKPGHPERVLFAAIAGAPLQIPTTRAGTTDWDALLGPGNPENPNDFYARRPQESVRGTSEHGAYSMRSEPDPANAGRVLPACYRREGAQTYGARPSRRVLEIARRFDESPLCAGQPCRNGMVTSVCGEDYSTAIEEIAERIQVRTHRCLPRALQRTPEANTGLLVVPCTVTEVAPEGVHCSELPGRTEITDPNRLGRVPAGRELCEVQQIGAQSNGTPGQGAGWYYRTQEGNFCAQDIAFTQGALPRTDSIVHIECLQPTAHSGTPATTPSDPTAVGR